MRTSAHNSNAQGLALLLSSIAGISVACSSLAPEGDPPPPAWPPGYINNGTFIICESVDDSPTGGTPPQFTCVDKTAFGIANPCHGQPGKNLYLQAICANTFGGVPSDYEVQKTDNDWMHFVIDWPASTNSGRNCYVDADFTISSEDPEVTKQVLFSSGAFDQCSRESYCETLDAIIDAYPGEAEPDPFRCNVSPTGDPDELGPWICVGSATDACGYAYITNENLPDPTPICPYVNPGGDEFCVLSTEEDASADCHALCDIASGKYDDDYGSVVYPPAGHFDCSVFDLETMVWASDPNTQCYNPKPIDPTEDFVPFSFEASLDIDGGANASMVPDEQFGLIDYEVSNCGGGYCDIWIKDLFLPYMEYAGTYYDSTSAPFPYTVSGISLELMGPVKGLVEFNRSGPATVTFPSWEFEVSLAVEDFSLDGTSLGSIDVGLRRVTLVEGIYSSTSGALTLDIRYQTVDAVMSLTLVTE